MKKFAIVSLLLSLALGSAVPAFAAPAKPTNVSVESKSPAGAALDAAVVGVTWTTATGAVAYSVSAVADGVAINGGTPVCVNQTCSSTISSMIGGTNYSVTVTSIDNAGATNSAAAVAFTAQSTPGLPTVSAPVAAANQITLNWTAPTNTGGLAITGYTISDGASINKTAAASASSIVISNVSAATPYTFKIKATNSLGSTSWVNFPTVNSLGKPAVPGTPTALASGTSLAVSWAAPSNGGSPITGYKVFVIQANGSDLGDPHVVAGENSVTTTITGLAAGIYTVKVIATNAVGDSSRSAASAPVEIAADLLPQIITFAAIESQTYPGTVNLSAAASSQLNVSFSASGACSLTGTTVTLLGVGSCTITAVQPGNNVYASADSVARTFTITLPSPSGGGGSSGGGLVITPTPGKTPTPIVTPTPSAPATPLTKVINAPSKVTATDIKKLNVNQVAAIPAATLAKLPVSVFASFTPVQAKSLSSTQVNAIPNAAIVRMNAKTVAALYPTVIAKLSLAKLAAFTNVQVKAMTAAQLKGLTKIQRNALGR